MVISCIISQMLDPKNIPFVTDAKEAESVTLVFVALMLPS